MKPFKPQTPEGSAPFNMALQTLEKIHEILKSIVKVSIAGTFDDEGNYLGEQLPEGKAQHVKYNLVRQLFIQSVTLLNKPALDEWRKKTYQRIRDIKLHRTELIKNGRVVRVVERYHAPIQDELDDLTIDIQIKLQEQGYFMPGKDDPNFGWKQ